MLVETGTLPLNTLQNQIAVITGAGRGIGYETARSLMCLGAKVVIAEIDPDLGRTAVSRLREEFVQPEVRFIQTDVGNEDDISSLREQVLNQYAGIDILINNATTTPMGAVQDVSIEHWDRSYRVNLRGPVLVRTPGLEAGIEKPALSPNYSKRSIAGSTMKQPVKLTYPCNDVPVCGIPADYYNGSRTIMNICRTLPGDTKEIRIHVMNSFGLFSPGVRI